MTLDGATVLPSIFARRDSSSFPYFCEYPPKSPNSMHNATSLPSLNDIFKYKAQHV